MTLRTAPTTRLAVALVLTAVVAQACGAGGSDDVAPPASAPASPPPTSVFPEPLRGEVRAFPADTLVIGVSAPLPGDGASFGADLRDAVRLAVEDHGARVAGVAVAVDARDDGCDDTTRSAAVATRFAQNPAVLAVIGPACNNGEFAAGPVYEYVSRIHISPSTTRVRTAERPLQTFFRTSWRDDAQGALLAGYALSTLGARRAFLIDDGTDYGQVVAYGFALAFNRLGGEIAGHTRAGGRGAADVVAAEPDAVLYAGLAAPGAQLVRGLRDAGYSGAILGPDALLDAQGFLELAGAAAEGVIASGAPPLPPEFVARFETRFGRTPASPFTAHAYDAAAALLAAAERVAATSPDGAIVISNERLREELLAQPAQGITGSLRFGPTGDREGSDAAALGLAFYEVRRGAFVAVPAGE